MNDIATLEHKVSQGWRKLSTLLVEAGRPKKPVKQDGVFVNYPLERGSTVLYPSIAAMRTEDQRKYDHHTLYGAMGSLNQHELEKVIALIEGGTDTHIVSSGLAACTIPLLAFLSAGDHCLLIDSVYGPTSRFSETVLKRFGVEVSYYPADCTVQEIETYLQPNTKVIFTESPGSHTFEIQDIRGIADLAHRYGIRLFLDNTWGIGIFKPFEHGVDLSIQSLTKFANGHSDLVLGAITVNNMEDWHKIRDVTVALGEAPSSDSCWLTLRGLRTLAARLEKQSISGLKVAQWCSKRPEIERVLHPALESCHGHEFWKRDFDGASSVFTLVFKPTISEKQLVAMIDHLKLFSIGASWGGYESLVLLTNGEIKRRFKNRLLTGVACRLHVGLENPDDLIQDLAQAFDQNLG